MTRGVAAEAALQAIRDVGDGHGRAGAGGRRGGARDGLRRSRRHRCRAERRTAFVAEPRAVARDVPAAGAAARELAAARLAELRAVTVFVPALTADHERHGIIRPVPRQSRTRLWVLLFLVLLLAIVGP